MPTILIVEDEPVLRDMARLILENCGYRLLEADSGKEALAVWQRACSAIDLLLTDIVMPGMNGPEMAACIHKTLPRLRVVFMSGYTEQALARAGEVDASFEYLQKPFTLKTLTQKVAKVLDNREAHAG